jgi:eukaryotic-like serine/threonine-protein kinase
MTERQPLGAPASPRRPPDPLHGTPYRALGPLGFGGMSEVLEAEHQGLRKRVVVKLLREELASDVRFVDRLRIEAQALAAISHPNIVSVTDLGQTVKGRPFIVMERLYGRTLRQELTARGAIAPAEAIEIVRQVLDGLGAAHRLGIVHRDVKLDNIIVCEPVGQAARVVKVLDFSIAKVLAAHTVVAAPECPTEEGMLVGTPRFVAPEQVKFQKVDARTDIYAAGLTLYTLVAGRGPFEHIDDALRLLNAHVSQRPAPPSHYAPRPLPPELDEAILRALAKSPEQRFQSAELFALALARISSCLTTTTTTRDTGSLANLPSEGALDGPTLLSPPFKIPGDLRARLGDGGPPSFRQVSLLAVLTVGSALVFSVVIALLFRYFGVH